MTAAMPLTDHKRIFITDCEGPISKNDNAFELAKRFIPDGEQLFTLISRYDDVLADIVRREGYKAGDTLKLILPFLKAYGVTDRSISEYSLGSVLLVSGARETLQFINRSMPTFIVSTSYEQYMRALCQRVDFSFRQVYCTRLDIDKYGISEEEKAELRSLREKMIKLPIPQIPKGARSLQDFTLKVQDTIKELDEFFWERIASMEIGAVLKDVNPLGGIEKASAVKQIASGMKAGLEDVMYVGDSITDVSAFRLVRRGNGVTISFNGNNFAVREAEVAILSENAIVTAILADVFRKFGKRHVVNLIRGAKNLSKLEEFALDEPLRECFLKLCRKKRPEVEIVTPTNVGEVMRKSMAFRKSVRGEAVGMLG